MKKPTAKTQREKPEIEQLSQAELVELVLGLQKIIEELQEKLAIANGKGRTNSKTSSQPPSLECGGIVRGSLPEGIVPGQDLNINLQALLVWLGNYGHLSYEKQQELVWELGEINIGTGTLQKTNQRVAEAVEPAINDLWEWATHRPNVHVDETPWCVMGVKEWLWTASGEGFCLFHAADTRGRVELETMLGTEFTGVLSSDDFSVYNGCQVQAQRGSVLGEASPRHLP